MKYKAQVGKIVVTFGRIFAKLPKNGFDVCKSEGSEFDKESNHPGERFQRPGSDEIRFSQNIDM